MVLPAITVPSFAVRLIAVQANELFMNEIRQTLTIQRRKPFCEKGSIVIQYFGLVFHFWLEFREYTKRKHEPYTRRNESLGLGARVFQSEKRDFAAQAIYAAGELGGRGP